MTGEEQQNELSTCQRIKAVSCHILTRSHTHSSPQCLNLMSQVPLNGSCIHQRPHTAIISLCYRQFIALYSTASISIRCCHDLHPSYCHVTYSLTFSIGKSLLMPQHMPCDGGFHPLHLTVTCVTTVGG